MFNLATLFVDIKADQGPLNNALSGVRGQLTQANVAVGTFVGNLATMAVRGAAALGGGLFESTIGSASNLNESISKVQTIFGQASGAIIGQADDMARTFGLSKTQMLDAAGVMGLMAKESGSSAGAAAEFGNNMTKLAADAMSFYNVPFDVALQKIQSGLSGEAQPLRDFGVFLTEAAVAEEAAAMGAQKVNGAFSEGAKIAARASLITQGLATASGDLERTFSGTENQTRAFWGSLTNLGQDIGTVLLPAFNSLLSIGASITMALGTAFTENRATFEGWVAGIVEAVNVVKLIWSQLGSVWEIVQIQASGMVLNTIAIFGSWLDYMGRLGTWFGNNWAKMIADALNAVGTAFTNFGTNVSQFGAALQNWVANPMGGWNFTWRPLLASFKATTEALPDMIAPALVDVQGQINAVTDRMATKTTADMAAAAAAAAPSELAGLAASAMRTEKMMPGGGEDAAGKFKSEIMGSAEFASKLRMAQGSEDVPAKQLTELQQIRELETRNVEMLEKALTNQVAILG